MSGTVSRRPSYAFVDNHRCISRPKILKYSIRRMLRLFQPFHNAFGVPPGGPHDGLADPGPLFTLHFHEDNNDPQASS